MAEPWNLTTLHSTLATLNSTIQFLKHHDLIVDARKCCACGMMCAWTTTSQKGDGHIWRCNACRLTYSIRRDSWFSRSKLPLKTIIEVVYYWTQDLPQDYVQFECGIGSGHTIVDLFMCCRQVCYEILEHGDDMLGGVGKIVEIDEAKFGRRKFHRGKRVDGVWVFGMVERGSNSSRCCLMTVDKRDEETLLGEVVKFIAPGTTIISDCWKAYSRLNELGYVHLTVNHSVGFKDHATGAHTNSIEGLWNLVRRSFPKFGTTKNMYASYLIEFIYRRRYFSMIARAERFSLFLNQLSILKIW
jgi:hypothetical protein